MTQIQNIIEKYQLPHNSFYLLELIPLIEMIWADGKAQHEEILILQDYTVRLLANLSQEADGMEVLSVDEANQFIDRFMKTRPSKEFLEDLKDLTKDSPAHHDHKEKMENMLSYCIDIAAACVIEYPFQTSERVTKDEKVIIKELIQALNSPS